MEVESGWSDEVEVGGGGEERMLRHHVFSHGFHGFHGFGEMPVGESLARSSERRGDAEEAICCPNPCNS